MDLRLSALMSHLPDSIVRLVAKPVVPGIVVDDLTQCTLPARDNLGVVFRHGSLGDELLANRERAEAQLIEVRYVDGDQRGTVNVTERQAHTMQLDFRKQVERDQIVSELRLPGFAD